ncbi:hypothetical protein GOODEAATRI_032637 [Goodea atripinnis]|uniref:Uncharacterized protein n=1 Tax=Goodea atripinnis TaxID=208336 RepID=A0ABV0NGJ9_9TELE
MLANTTQEPLGNQFEGSVVLQMNNEQGETAVKECEESGTYNEEQMEEDATELPASPEIFREGAQRPQRPHRKPKVFTYERLGSPVCYNLRTLPPPTHLKMPWMNIVHPYYISYGQ